MEKILSSLIIASCLMSCSNNKPEANIKTIEEVEFFYLEYLSKGAVVHLDKDCSDRQCVYLEKSKIKQLDDYLCSKCISPELAKEILENKY